MFADDPSDPDQDTPRQAWLAYLDRMMTADQALQVGESTTGQSCLLAPDAQGIEERICHELLSEAEFCSQLSLLDELSLREIEGRLSEDLLEQMQELRFLLLGELDDAPEEFALPPMGSQRPTTLRRGKAPRSAPEASGARNRRHLWRQNRRGDR